MAARKGFLERLVALTPLHFKRSVAIAELHECFANCAGASSSIYAGWKPTEHALWCTSWDLF